MSPIMLGPLMVTFLVLWMAFMAWNLRNSAIVPDKPAAKESVANDRLRQLRSLQDEAVSKSSRQTADRAA